VVGQQRPARRRHEGRQALEQLQRFQEQRGRAVAPRAPELVEELAARALSQSLQRQRRTQEVPAHPLQLITAACRHRHVGVQAEAFEPGTPWGGCLSAGGRAEAPEHLPGPRAEGHAALQRGREQMSLAADVRIAWGGKEVVEAIRSLPARWECEDITFGPRASFAVIDPAEVNNALLERLTTDIVYFDQLACSSPQWIYHKGRPNEPAWKKCVDSLFECLERQTKSTPRHMLGFDQTYQIHLDRARVLLSGGMLYRDNATQWTVAILKAPCVNIACVNRFVQIIPFWDLAEIYPTVPRNVQTVILALEGREIAEFTEQGALLALNGESYRPRSHAGLLRSP
jgi:hypothetical protein